MFSPQKNVEEVRSKAGHIMLCMLHGLCTLLEEGYIASTPCNRTSKYNIHSNTSNVQKVKERKNNMGKGEEKKKDRYVAPAPYRTVPKP